MKCILIAGAVAFVAGGQAIAADLPMAAPPTAPAYYKAAPLPFSWTGIYLGVNGGYNFGTVAPTGGGNISTNGFLGGGTLGGNYQMGSFVIGLEGDGDYNSTNNNGFKSDWLATVRGRAGWALDRVLLYGTGGAAFAPAAVIGGSTTMTGWTAGGGIEYAFTPNWTAKVEYLYVDFPSPNIAGGTFKFTDNLIRGGINYKFW
jgi:outer membrane immunogenic protein